MNAHHCALCRDGIKDYDARLNHLALRKSLSVDICSSCIDAFAAWQGNVLSRLFPTKAMKKLSKR
ncbi:MAG: hypothetical protein ABIH41_07320 [Nanoarchaeota archaeon]